MDSNRKVNLHILAIALCRVVKSTFTDDKWNKHFGNNLAEG